MNKHAIVLENTTKYNIHESIYTISYNIKKLSLIILSLVRHLQPLYRRRAYIKNALSRPTRWN